MIFDTWLSESHTGGLHTQQLISDNHDTLTESSRPLGVGGGVSGKSVSSAEALKYQECVETQTRRLKY